MGQMKTYTREYKEEAVKLTEEKGPKRASEELGISYHTLYGWVKSARAGNLHMESRSSKNIASLEERIAALEKKNRQLEKENRNLREEREILADAAAFFAESRRKSTNSKE